MCIVVRLPSTPIGKYPEKTPLGGNACALFINTTTTFKYSFCAFLEKVVKIKTFNFTTIFLLLLLVPLASASISKFQATPLASGVIRVTFTISNDSSLNSFTLLKDDSVLKQGPISGMPFSDLIDDLDTKNKEKYTYTLKTYDLTYKFVEEKNITAQSDSDYPIIVSERKILSKQNTLTIKTNENSFCKAGVSPTNLFPMEGKNSQIHFLRIGLVNGLNILYAICEDEYGNMMPNTKLIEYNYDSIPPGQIKTVDALNHLPGQVVLSWAIAKDANGIAHYNVYRRADGSEKDELIAVTNLTTFSDEKSLREGQTYKYSVSATDNADNEGPKSALKNITIYNSNVFLDVAKNHTTKTGNITIIGRAEDNAQITAKMDSFVYETTADQKGDFSLSINTEKSRTLTIEAFDNNGNSKITTISITRLAPPPEVEKIVQIREEKTNLTYVFLIAFLFFAIIFIVIYSTRRRTLYGDIDHYMGSRRKKER